MLKVVRALRASLARGPAERLKGYDRYEVSPDSLRAAKVKNADPTGDGRLWLQGFVQFLSGRCGGKLAAG